MICSKCQATADKAKEVFTNAERMYLVSAAVAMLRSVLAGRDASNDKQVASSVITKLLLSYPPEGRAILTQEFKKIVGIEITLGSCPHGQLLSMS